MRFGTTVVPCRVEEVEQISEHDEIVQMIESPDEELLDMLLREQAANRTMGPRGVTVQDVLDYARQHQVMLNWYEIDQRAAAIQKADRTHMSWNDCRIEAVRMMAIAS